MKAIITLIHGTWAQTAGWTLPDSELCRSLRQTAEQVGVQVEFRTHTWSALNSVRARKAAAQALIERLRKDFEQSPVASHFLIAHSHGGNIVIDAVRAEGIGEQVSGIVTMSTPFVSCRRSGIQITGVILVMLLAVLVVLEWTSWIGLFLFQGVNWVWNQADSHISSGLILWPVRLMLSFLSMRWSWELAKLPIELLKEVPSIVWETIEGFQDSVLERFDCHLKQPIPVFCLRFRMDEALVALNVSRLFVKPIRLLTIIASWVVAISALFLLIVWSLKVPVYILTNLLDLVFSSNITRSVELNVYRAVFAAWLLFDLGVPATILFLIIWLILGYVMGAMTLGHWGGILDQLLVDFRITGSPEGASALSKVYSPLRWRRILLHSLTTVTVRRLPKSRTG